MCCETKCHTKPSATAVSMDTTPDLTWSHAWAFWTASVIWGAWHLAKICSHKTRSKDLYLGDRTYPHLPFFPLSFNFLNPPIIHKDVDFALFLVDLLFHLKIKCLTIWWCNQLHSLSFHLNLLCAFLIHCLHFLFPLLSMHEADNTGSPEIYNPPTGKKWMALMI